MPRAVPAICLTLSPAQTEELSHLVRCGTSEQRLVCRAKIVLAHAEGASLGTIERTLKVARNTVRLWCRRVAVAGLQALHDLPRGGSPIKHGKALEHKVLALIEQPAPQGRGRWTGKLVAQALGVPQQAVARALRANGIHLARKRSWCVSKDPEFAHKAADVVGLYLSPPANAVVLSVDEKPSIQALERARGFANSGKSVVRGQASTYKRGGVANLFAALNVATGHVLAETTQTKTRVDFLKFMDKVVVSQPVNTSIHVVMDNLRTHKRCEAWLAAHPNVTFHFTPTGASWLNQVKIWFNILTRQALDGASFASLDQLVQALHDYTAKYNEVARPFKWRKREVKGTQLRNTVRNLRI